MKPTFLYIKQHNKTGLKYFGKTTRDPEKYIGSGKRWQNHLKVHGPDISTTWYQLFLDEESITAYALKFSEENRIVESDEWANLKPENGTDGGDHGALTEAGRQRKAEFMKNRIITEKTREKLSCSLKGKKKSDEHNKHNSAAQKGKPGRKGADNGMFGKVPWNKGLKIGPTGKKAWNSGLSTGPNPAKSHPAWNKGLSIPSPNKGKKFGPQGPRGPQIKLTCPHCDKVGGASMLKRYHFDNCKIKK